MKRAELSNHVNERMFEFGERIGWTLQNVDEKLISDFCSKIGVKKRVLKVWLYNNKKKNYSKCQPTADILPELVIQKILSNLNYVQASRMTILSKTWLQAWLTHPNLLLVAYSGTEEEKEWRRIGKLDTDIVDKIMKRYRDEKIPIDKFELSMDIVTPTGYLFSSIDKWLDIALQNGVRDLVYRNLGYHSSFNIFKVLKAKYLRELVLRNCNLVYFRSLPSSDVRICHSLRKLSLISVTLDDNMLQGLLNNYPLIENLIIRHCRGWKKCEVRNLQKIRSLDITIEKEQLVKIQAPTLEHLSYSSYFLEKLNIVEYPNLKSLKLSGEFASTRLNIGRSESLKVLKIKNLNIFYSQKIEVDAPNLVSLAYGGEYLPQIKLSKESSKFKNLILYSCGCIYHVYDKWFCKLIESLSNSTSWSQVSIQVSLHTYTCGEINMEHLKQHYRVAIPQVDVVDVIIESRDNFPTFVDALLWCFHPRRLNILSSFKMIVYLINQLLYMKNSSHGNKPQLSQLKAYKFDCKNRSWHPVSMKLITGDPKEMVKFYFLLNW